ncbi:MAG: flagellar type III secretion system protein FlhB [Betaproteobacteria bacterium]|jgi:flagellar biosynthetic protein FlhB|nr:flagellar type III secretion system protein FlhB [Betaproteobacteria bacterium]
MAESQQSDLEKTEPASARRLEQAREQGQVARSTELTSFFVLIVSGGILLFAGATFLDGMRKLFSSGLQLDRASAFDTGVALSRLYVSMLDALWVLAPLFVASVLVALIAPMLLSGWLFSVEALQPKISRLSPVANLGRTFSWHGLVELVKAVLKMVLLGAVVVAMLWTQREAMAMLALEPIEMALAHVGSMMTDAFVAVMLAMVLIVAIDVPFQIWNHIQQLRMTKEEVRQEGKETEGNPEVKGRIRAMQREMARRRMMSAVPKADVVITNPTHYAVALQYQEGRMRAPQVVAKGTRETAERILALARENDVPVLRAPPLARSLYRHAEVGEGVPAALYGAVAEVLAWVYQLRLARGYGSVLPVAPTLLDVPAALDPGPDPDDAMVPAMAAGAQGRA